RAAVIDLQYRVTARGEEGRPPVEGERIARMRTAMHERDGGKRAGSLSRWKCEIGRHAHAVARRIFDCLSDRRSVFADQIRIAIADAQQSRFPRLIEIVAAGVVDLLPVDEKPGAVPRP